MNDERLRELYGSTIRPRGGPREDCPSPETLLALARREGAEDRRLETLDHAMRCADCRAELDLLRAVEAGAPARPRELVLRHPRLVRGIIPIALAASLVVATSVTLLRGSRPRSPETDVARGDAGALVVHAPSVIELRRGEPLTLAWTPEPSATGYVLEVLDANGGVVLSRRTRDTTVVIPELGALADGREYRWWIRVEGMEPAQRSSVVGRLRIVR